MRKVDTIQVQRALAAMYVARAAYMAAFSETARCLDEGAAREALFEIERLLALIEAELKAKKP